MKTLLALIKHPGKADKFLKYAMGFAGDMDLNLRVMYVEDPAHYPIGSTELSGAVVARMQESLNVRMKEGRQQLSSMVSDLTSDVPGWQTVEVDAEAGNDTRIINDLVDEGSIHMVMLSNLDDDFWYRDTRIGNIAREANCPVWVIPENAEYTPIRKVLYTTDYKEEDIPTMKKLIELTQEQEPEITALHVTEDVDFELRIKNAGFQKMLETKTGYDRITLRAMVPQQGEDAAELVNNYSERIHADLIVVLQENLSFLERLFGQDQASRVLEEANKPVLLYHSS